MVENKTRTRKPNLRITIPRSPDESQSKPINRCQTPRYVLSRTTQDDVCTRLRDWEIVDYTVRYGVTGHFVVGILPSGRIWETSDIRRIEINSTKIKAITKTGSKYDLYLTDSRNGDIQSFVFPN